MPNVRIQKTTPNVGVRSSGRNTGIRNDAVNLDIESAGPYVTYGITYNEATIEYNDSTIPYNGETAVATEIYMKPNTGITSKIPTIGIR